MRISKRILALSALMMALAAATEPAHATLRYVNAGRPDDSGDGLTWATAYRTLQAALQPAASGAEIWVTAGIYKPYQGPGITPGNRAATFLLISGVSIYGGFAGTETMLSQRDLVVKVPSL